MWGSDQCYRTNKPLKKNTLSDEDEIRYNARSRSISLTQRAANDDARVVLDAPKIAGAHPKPAATLLERAVNISFTKHPSSWISGAFRRARAFNDRFRSAPLRKQTRCWQGKERGRKKIRSASIKY